MHFHTAEAPERAPAEALDSTPDASLSGRLAPRQDPNPIQPVAGVPVVSMTFADFGLAEPILRAVTEIGYREPTPIQAQAIPVVMEGRDVMGAAQTGTGKTAGFALPIINSLMPLANASASPARHPVRALILAPTRELADQIAVNVAAYAKYTPLRSTVVFGGVDMNPQTQALRRGVEILTATPGRLLDHVGQRTLNLSQVQILVLDEADRMLDMGFLPDIQRIINLLGTPRQNLMFSATFSEEIRRLAKSFLHDPQLIEVARRYALADNVDQQVFRVATDETKRAAVGHLVRERALDQVIVFTNTKLGASRLARQLQRDGLNADAIHGDKSQQDRLQTLDGFKEGRVKVLVATDVAARGLDIVELPAVINFDLPHSPEDYVHRIGRTGRAGASGQALSLMTERDARSLADIEKLIRRKLPVEDLALAAPAGGDEMRPRDRQAAGHRTADRPGDRGGNRGSDRGVDRGVDRSDRREPRGGRGARGPRAQKAPVDPLFLEPYQPVGDPPPGPTVEDPGMGTSLGRGQQRPRKIAVLLGGKPPGAA